MSINFLFQDSFKGQNMPSNMEKGQTQTNLFTIQQDGPEEVNIIIVKYSQCNLVKAIWLLW